MAESTTPTAAASKETTTEGSTFFGRLAELPAVAAACDMASKSYNYVKDSNEYVNYTLSAVEKTAQSAVDQSKPVLEKISGPVQYVDGMACKGLEKVEEILPSVKKQPEEIANDAKSFVQGTYNSAKEFSAEKIQQVKDLSTSTVSVPMEATTAAYNQCCEMLRSSTLDLINAADSYLDHYLPAQPKDEKSTQDGSKDVSVAGQMSHLSDKARTRLTEKTLNHFESMKAYGSKRLEDLQMGLKLLQEMKERGISSVQELSSSTVISEFKPAFLDQVMNEERYKDIKDLQTRMLSLTRSASEQVNDILATSLSAFSYFPKAIKESYFTALRQASDLSSKVTSLPLAEKLTSATIQDISGEVLQLQQTFLKLSSDVLQRVKSSTAFPYINSN